MHSCMVLLHGVPFMSLFFWRANRRDLVLLGRTFVPSRMNVQITYVGYVLPCRGDSDSICYVPWREPMSDTNCKGHSHVQPPTILMCDHVAKPISVRIDLHWPITRKERRNLSLLLIILDSFLCLKWPA